MRRVGVLTAAVVAAHLPGAARAIDSAKGGLAARLVVSEDPAGFTPHVLDGRVDTLTRVGDRIIAGGRFGKVREADSDEVLNRKNIFSFDARTGKIDRSFNPAPDDAVGAVIAAPDGDSVFVGGRFRRIAGQSQPVLARLEVPSGRLVGEFAPAVESRIDDLALHGSRLFLSGEVTSLDGEARWGLAAVDVEDGAGVEGVAVKFSEPRDEVLTVNRIAVAPNGSRLVAVGSFLEADGQSRPQLAVLDLDDDGATLADWHTDKYAEHCSSSFGPTYMRDVEVSADSSFFAVATTGGKAKALCDTVARFELGGNARGMKPTWVAHSGGDSFTGLGITDAAIYVGGHQRWMNNPWAQDTGKDATQGIGSVPRPGISALDPVNGLPLSWNPGRERGLGVFAFLATPEGLWIGHDTDEVGGEYHSRLAFFPSKGGKSIDPAVPARLPGVLYRSVSSTAPGLAAQTIDKTIGKVEDSPDGDLDWSKAKVAFPAGGRLYVVWADGHIDSRPIEDDGELGEAQLLDLGGLDTYAKAKFPVRSLTGAAYDPVLKRLYYTLAGDKRLYYRYFLPESGVLGGFGLVASDDSKKLDGKKVRGLFLADGYIYYASGSDDDVYRTAFRDGKPVKNTTKKLK